MLATITSKRADRKLMAVWFEIFGLTDEKINEMGHKEPIIELVIKSNQGNQHLY